MTRHTDILEVGRDGSAEQAIGRVVVIDGLVKILDARRGNLEELLLIPRFSPDGSPCSLTDMPERYLQQLSQDLGDGLGLRATPVHESAECSFSQL